MVAFESVSTFLHFCHFVAAITSLAVCVHLLVRLIRHLRSGNHWGSQVRLHALTLLIAYVTTYALGALIYPTFRVRVRADFLDETMPFATGLFEIKEHAASIMLLPVIAIFILSRTLDLRQQGDRAYALLFGGLVSVVLCVLVYNACVGWYLGTLRSV